MVWTEKQGKVCCGSKWNSKEERKLSMDSKDDVQAAAGLVALFRFLGEESSGFCGLVLQVKYDFYQF